jgi:transposase
MDDSTTILFGLPGVEVARVERASDEVRVVHVRTADETAAACPACGVFSTSVRQRRTTRPKDLPYGEEPLAVRWHKVQWRCREAGCPRRAFTESIAELPPRARVTGRLRRHAGKAVGAGRAVSAVSADLPISWPTVHAAFVAHAENELAEPEPPRVLGIDETRRGRPVWRRGTDGRWERLDRFETNFVDLTGTGGLLGQAAGRTKTTVTDWLDARGPAWKAAVEVVAIDPCATYRRAVTEALPHARIVADHFHVSRLGNSAVTAVRQRVTREQAGRRGRKADPAWANRRRLPRGRERLSDRQFARMWNDLVDAEPSGELLAAWIAKEELRALLACAARGGVRSDIAHRLTRFYAWCAAHDDIGELVTLAETVQAWWPQILGFLELNITNAGTEGTNHLIKDAARVAFGFRNLDNQRRRVRFHCTRRHRTASARTRDLPPQP